MDASDAVRAYAEDKVAKLQRFLRTPIQGHVTLSCQHHRLHTAEIDVHSGGERFHATETSEDMYASIDGVADKLERQVRETKPSRKGGERASDKLMADLLPSDDD
jgi:putative sigma-54 modulation protein